MIQNRLSNDRKTVRTQDDPYDVTKHNASDDNEEALLLEELADVSDAHDAKLGTIEQNAKDDQTDEEIETAYNTRVSAGSQGEAEAGTSTTIRRWSIAIIFAGWLSWIANKTVLALNTTNKTIIGAINELKTAIDGVSGGPPVPQDYTTVASLLADQNSQNTDSLYRIHDGERDFHVQYLGTTNGDYKDYSGWSLDTFYWKGNNETFTEKAGQYNLAFQFVKVTCDAPLTSELSVDPQVGGVSILDSPLVIAVGGIGGVASNFATGQETMDAWEAIETVIANTNTNIALTIATIEISDAIDAPIPQLIAPILDSVTVTSPTSLTANWTDTNDSPNEATFTVGYQTTTWTEGPANTITGIAQNEVTQLISGLTTDQAQFVRVMAIGDGVTADSSDWSNIIEATPTAATSQSDQIAALSDLWAFIKGYEAASPLLDSSGNGRSFTGQGSLAYQQAAIETTDSGAYSIRATASQSSEAIREESFSLNQDFEIGFIVRPNATLITGRGMFGLKNSAGNEHIRFGTDTSAAANARIITRNPAGSNSESNSAGAVWSVNTTYFVTLRYVSSTGTFTLFVNNVAVVTHVINVSSWVFDTISWGNSTEGSVYSISAFYQKLFFKVGSTLTDQERTDIYNAGNYLAAS